jgi:hypothetical protein
MRLAVLIHFFEAPIFFSASWKAKGRAIFRQVFFGIGVVALHNDCDGVACAA